MARAALRTHLRGPRYNSSRTEFVIWASARRRRRLILLVGGRRRRAARTLRVCSRRICRAIPEALVPSSIEFGTASRDFGDLVIGAPIAGNCISHVRRQTARGHWSDLGCLWNTSNRLEFRYRVVSRRRTASLNFGRRRRRSPGAIGAAAGARGPRFDGRDPWLRCHRNWSPSAPPPGRQPPLSKSALETSPQLAGVSTHQG